MSRAARNRNSKRRTSLIYQQCEARTMLTTFVDVGDLNSGVAVSDDATGEGFIMFSLEDVHDRFTGMGADNANHFVATRLDGLQWQYNNDTTWIDFQPTISDALVEKVNFSGDSVLQSESISVLQGILWHQTGPQNSKDIIVAPNQFGGEFNKGEFTVLADVIGVSDVAPPEVFPSEIQLDQIREGFSNYERAHDDRLPGLASFDTDGNPLLSWRVHLLPHMGLENLYQQFNLDEPWNSSRNLALADQMPDVYKSVNFASTNRTTFLGVAGQETGFQLDGTPIGTDSLSEPDAVVVEVNNSHAAIWTSPVDWYYNPSSPLSGLGNASPEGFAITGLSNESMTIAADVNPDAFANFIDITDGTVPNYEALGIEPLDSFDALRDLTQATLKYESAFRRLPHLIRADDGAPLLSWRVAILPALGHNELYQQFNLDEPWDSAHNLALLPQIPLEFMHASVTGNKTVYLGLDGDGTVFDSQLDQGITLDQLLDGSSNTILLVEADASEAVEWTRPTDLNYDSANPNRGLGSQNDDARFRAGLADATANGFLINEPAKVTPWASYAGGEVGDHSLLEFRTWETDAGIAQNLRHMMLASLNYESALMKFPHTIYDTPSGEGSPLLSWRVRILPFLEQGNLYNQFRFDEPWDSTHNLSLLPLMPEFFRSPGVENGKTVFQGPHGDNTFLSNENRGRTFGDLPERNTAAILQVAPEQAIEWTRPGDFEYDADTIRSFFDNADANGFHFTLTDGSTLFFNDTISTDVLNKIVSPADYSEVDLDPMLFSSHDANAEKDLKQAALAALNFESANMHFPHHATYTENRGGTPLLSWRVQVLPFLGYDNLYDRFNHDEPWDSEHNLSLLPLMPHYFSHPGIEHGKTALQAITTPWASGNSIDSIFPLTNEIDVGFGRITDGSSNTILFAETSADLAVEWTKPDDLLYDASNPTAGLIEGRDGQGTWVTFADGSSHFFESNLRVEQWEAAVSPSSGSFPSISLDSSYYYGTVTQNQNLGTDGDDNVLISVDGNTLELTINGETQTFTYPESDRVFLDGLGGDDSLTILGPDGVEIEFSDGTLQVGPFSVVAVGFESTAISSDSTFVVRGTDGDDVFEVGEFGSAAFIDSSVFETQFVRNLPGAFSIDGRLGEDHITALMLNADAATFLPNQYSASETTALWTNVESIRVLGGMEATDVTILGTSGDDRLSFNGTVATMLGPDGLRRAVENVGLINANGGNGNDSAFLAGTSDGANTFFGSQRTGRLTTPQQVVATFNFELVAATSNGENDLASFEGTMADEDFFASPETARFVGTDFIRNATGFERVIADSGGGADFANITDSAGEDFLFARPNFAKLEAAGGNSITVNNFPTVRSVSSIGDDVAQFFGSENDERFLGSDRFGRLNGDGFSMIAVSFPSVRAAGNGGNDEAYLSDSEGDDFFFGSPTRSYLNGDGFQNTAVNFGSVVALASEGRDTAEFNGTEGDDRFYGNPSVANLTGEGFFQFGSGFDFVRAFGNGGDDAATLRDSDNDDRFFSNSEYVYLRNDNFHNEVRGFGNVKALSVGGADFATFEGSDGQDDFFHGHRDSSFIERGGFRSQANGFAEVLAVGLTGVDSAELHDSEEDDVFGARENAAWLEGETYRIRVTDFESVGAFGFRGGVNRTFIDNPDFDWSIFGAWEA